MDDAMYNRLLERIAAQEHDTIRLEETLRPGSGGS